MNEGMTAVSEHMAKYNHKEGDIESRILDHETNWHGEEGESSKGEHCYQKTESGSQCYGRRKIPIISPIQQSTFKIRAPVA